MKHQPTDQTVILTQALPLDWIQDALSRRFGDIQGVETVKSRPWSQVYRFVAEGGISYFKICGPDARYESSLLDCLSPDYSATLPEIIALASEHGSILMADAEIPFRELPGSETHRQSLHSLLSRYGRLQQHTLNHINDLLEMSLFSGRG